MDTSITIQWSSSLSLVNYFQVVAEYNSTNSVGTLFNSSTAQSFPNGSWSATLTGLRPGSRYNIYVTSLVGEVTSSPAGPVTVLTSSSELFQLVIPLTTSCNTWINDSPSEKSQDISSHITSVLTSQCQCSLDVTAITNGGFQCFTGSPEFVTYRAQIYGTSEVAASDLIRIIEEWLTTSPSFNVRAQFLNVYTSCPVSIASLDAAECDTSLITTTAVTDTEEAASGGVSVTIIAIIIAAVCVILIAVVVVAAVIIFFKLRKRTQKKAATQYMHSSDVKLHHYKLKAPELPPPRIAPDAQYETVDEAVMSRNSVIQNKGALEDEFSFTSCEAYDTRKPPMKSEEALDYEVATPSKKEGNAYEQMDGGGQQSKTGGNEQSYEVIRDHSATDSAYEVVRGEKSRIKPIQQCEEFGGSQELHYVT